MPHLSVVLPTLNEAETVGRALESLAAQSYQDFEVLVIDDGSTDGTVSEVLRHEPDLPALEVVERTDKRGIASARNRGIEAASGEFLACQDADDWSHPDRFRRQVSFLEDNPEVALVGTSVHQVGFDGTYRNRRHVYENPPKAVYRAKSPFVQGSVMMRTDDVRAVGGYDELFPTSEDRDLWLRLRRQYKLRNVDEPLYWLRFSSESTYASDIYEAKLYGQYAYTRTLEGRVPEGYDETVDRDGSAAIEAILTEAELADVARGVSRESLRWGKRQDSRKYALQALERRPLDSTTAATLLLSFAPEPVVDTVINLYRSKLNWEIRRANAST